MKHRQLIWKTQKWWYWILAISCFLFLNEFQAPKSISTVKNEIETEIQLRLDSITHEFQKNTRDLRCNSTIFYGALYKKDSLLAWNNNTFIPKSYEIKEDGLLKQGNSWFYTFRERSKDNEITLVGAIPIKEKPLLNNRNLNTKWILQYLESTDYNLAELSKTDTFPSNSIIRINNKKICALYLDKEESKLPISNDKTNWAIIILTILSIIFYEIPLFAICKRIKILYGNGISLFAFIVFQIITTYLLFRFHFPRTWFNSIFFNSTIYASSSWLPTLGHYFALLFNINILILFLFYHLRHWIRAQVRMFPVYILLINGIQIGFIWLVQSVFTDANFNILNPNIALWDKVSLATLCLLLFSGVIMFIILPISCFPRGAWDKKRKHVQIFQLTIILVCVIIILIQKDISYQNLFIHFILQNTLLIIVSELYYQLKKDNLQIFYVLFLSLFSLYFFSLLNYNKNIKELKHREYIARQLIKEADPTFKFLIPEIISKIESDASLSERFHHILERDGEKASLLPYLIQSYFQGYFNRYQIKFALSTPDYKGRLGTLKASELIALDTLIKNGFSLPTTDKVYEVRNNKSFNGFIARIPLIDKNYRADILYLTFTQPIRLNRRLFPELLQNEKWTENLNSMDLSYGIYNKKSLIQQYGNLSFPNTYNDSITKSIIDADNKNENFKTLSYFPNGIDNKGIVLASHMGDLMNSLFLFIIFYTMCMLILLLLLNPVPMTHKYFPLSSRSLGNRIFFANSLLLLTLLVAIGIFGYYYFNRQAEINAKENILATSDNIIKGLQNSLITEKSILSNNELNDKIQKLSSLFETDICLYKSNGQLICSSQPSIYELGIIAPIINPVAKKELEKNPGVNRIIDEQIGKLHFSSFYAALPLPSYKEDKNVIIGIPYYNRQREKQENNSGILFKLIGIFALFFVLTTLFNYYLSSRISSSLKVLGNRLKGINLSNANTPIEWKEKDEVGLLIEQYNIMLEQLAISANALAKSERETAWREMARQVAHEIKNPLTPMKLSIQFLQRAIHDQRDDLGELTQKTAETLVEQIENLSLIANQFGQFAQISSNQLENIDIISVVHNSCNLYRRNEQCVTIQESHQKESVSILGNKTQLLSVFNNILLNAIQAIPEETEGWIHVDSAIDKNHITIKIIDNGSGIEADKLNKIFEPNFTTKNSGTGLGLAIAKTIIQASGGDIQVTSTKNKGSEFIISLPLHSY